MFKLVCVRVCASMWEVVIVQWYYISLIVQFGETSPIKVKEQTGDRNSSIRLV